MPNPNEAADRSAEEDLNSDGEEVQEFDDEEDDEDLFDDENDE